MIQKIKNFIEYNKLLVLLVLVTFTSVTITGFVFGTPFWRLVPLWVSHIIMLLTTKANRFAHLLGGLNSILYAAVYFSLTLYSSAFYAFLFSFPMQIISFITWNKEAYKHTTILKSMSKKQFLTVNGCIVGIWLFLSFVWPLICGALSFDISGYLYLDNATSILGIAATVFCTLKYIEYPLYSIASGIIGLFLNITIVINDPGHTPYLIYGVYSLICVSKGYFYMTKIHNDQKSVLFAKEMKDQA